MKQKLVLIAGIAAALVVIFMVYASFGGNFFEFFAGKQEKFTATLTADVTNLTATFQTNVTGGTPPYSYIWDFGDNTTRITSESKLNYTYQAAGSYIITVMVKDKNLNLAETKVTVTVA